MSGNTDLTPIGFTAYVETKRTYNIFEPVIFETTLSNIGNAYDSHSSIFTCPVTGVYVITVSVTGRPGTVSDVNIMQDNQWLVSAYADSAADHISAATMTAVVECTSGQRIWVESAQLSTTYGDHVAYWRSTAFSGFLLNAY